VDPSTLFHLMSADQKQQLLKQYRRVPQVIQPRQIAHFTKADSAYGQDVAERLGLVPKLQSAE
jgi:catalase